VRKALAPALLVITLLLGGCTATSTPPTSSPTPTPTIADPALRPVLPPSLTADSAKAETERLADAIDDLIIPSTLVYVDNHSVLVAGSNSAKNSWGVLRTITLTPSTDPSQVAQSVIAVLEHSGWVLLHNTTDSGTTVVALASGIDTKKSWYLLVSADASKVGQSVVTVQLESPALP
jgi:hypothetical protein